MNWLKIQIVYWYVYTQQVLCSLLSSQCLCYLKYDAIWSHLCVTLLANPIRSRSVCMYFLLYGTVCERAKVVTARSDGYQGWLCTAAYVQCSTCACAGILTLACWHGATPGAIAGAGPRDSLVPSDHHVARLAHECHILAHCGVIPNSETVGWNARVTTGDHCQWWPNTRNLHQTSFSVCHQIFSFIILNNR